MRAHGHCLVRETSRGAAGGSSAVVVGTVARILALSLRFKLLFPGSSRFGWLAVVFWISAATPRAWHHRCIFLLGILAKPLHLDSRTGEVVYLRHGGAGNPFPGCLRQWCCGLALAALHSVHLGRCGLQARRLSEQLRLDTWMQMLEQLRLHIRMVMHCEGLDKL